MYSDRRLGNPIGNELGSGKRCYKMFLEFLDKLNVQGGRGEEGRWERNDQGKRYKLNEVL